MRRQPKQTRSRADLLRIRTQLRLTQLAFAERFGLRHGWVTDVERGHGADDLKTRLLLAAIERAPDMMAEAASAVGPVACPADDGDE